MPQRREAEEEELDELHEVGTGPAGQASLPSAGGAASGGYPEESRAWPLQKAASIQVSSSVSVSASHEE